MSLLYVVFIGLTSVQYAVPIGSAYELMREDLREIDDFESIPRALSLPRLCQLRLLLCVYTLVCV